MKGPRLPRWLYPGMHLKRWLVLLLAGIAILGLGAAIFIRDLYRQNAADEIAVVYWLTGAWLEPEIRAALVAVLGLTLTGIGFWGLMRSVISPFVARGGSVMEVLYTKRYLARGPRIVALGCTGGYHRSIALAEALATRLKKLPKATVEVFHRELER